MGRFKTFEEFRAHADKLVQKRYGVGIDDLSDAPWWDTWSETIEGQDPTDTEILDICVDLLAAYDDLFASIVEVIDGGSPRGTC